MIRFLSIPPVLLMLAAAGCRAREASPDSVAAAPTTPSASDSLRMAPSVAVPSSLPSGYVIDSAIPIPEAIRRFQSTVPNRPAVLGGGALSLDTLFARYAKALAQRDTAALRTLVLTRAEFAWLYYPESRQQRDPYSLQPDFLWRFINDDGEKGVTRAFERFGAAGWSYRGYRCDGAPRREGHMVLHGPCTVTLRSPEGVEVRSRLVNEVVERDGRFKLTGFANEL